jgi:serine/threonine-protein kinase
MDNVSGTTPPAATVGELDLTGRTLADYRILRRLGAGGMGQVYLAEQISLTRKVALKVLRPDLVAGQPEAMERFRAEAKAVARATHANIVQVYAIGEADGVWYMALEYVEGRNLREYLSRKGPPDVLLALSIMRQVAAALHRAAELGIIHRDIKPENILLTRKGEVKVADFGLSRCLSGEQPLNLTRSGVTMGTPLYMSPEQVEGRPLDPRTDIYSFGVTCYHMLAGHPPFRGETAFEVALQHVRGEPPPLAQVRPDLPEALSAIVHKMMAKDPAARYQTARDLLKDVGRLREALCGGAAGLQPINLAPESTPSSPAAPTVVPVVPIGAVTTRALPAAGRRPWLAFLVAASLVIALSLGAAFGWLRRHAAGPAHAAGASAEGEVTKALKVERARRTLAEEFLKDPKAADPALGLGECLKVGLDYLDHDRLADAEAWFRRLAEQPPGACRTLGHLGLGIALALESKAAESNKTLREWALLAHPRVAAHVKAANPGRVPSPALRFWLLKALDYNRKNGIKDEDVAPGVRYVAYGKP